MTHEICLETGSDMIIRQGGSTIELHAEGDITVKAGGAQLDVHPDGTVNAYTDSAVKLHPPIDDASANREPRPGDRMADGTIYAGVSPDTGKPMYTTPADAPLTMKWKAAMNYAAKLDAHGHQDWRVPTLGELKLLFNNRAAIGGFNVTGSHPAGWYWSSTDGNYGGARGRRFSDGYPYWSFKEGDSSLRCVR